MVKNGKSKSNSGKKAAKRAAKPDMRRSAPAKKAAKAQKARKAPKAVAARLAGAKKARGAARPSKAFKHSIPKKAFMKKTTARKIPQKKVAAQKKAPKAVLVAAAAPRKPEMPRRPPSVPISPELQAILAKSEARQWLIELGGENAIDVMRELPEVPHDEALAKKLKIKISDVRASLNKMHSEGLVAYVRDKNSETGWFSYAWVINEPRIRKWVEERYSSQVVFEPKEGKAFYFCKGCGIDSTLSFENATECNFKCAKCNCLLDHLDETKFAAMKRESLM
jgi:transcription factor E